jgi:hypothetical protein
VSHHSKFDEIEGAKGNGGRKGRGGGAGDDDDGGGGGGGGGRNQGGRAGGQGGGGAASVLQTELSVHSSEFESYHLSRRCVARCGDGRVPRLAFTVKVTSVRGGRGETTHGERGESQEGRVGKRQKHR